MIQCKSLVNTNKKRPNERTHSKSPENNQADALESQNVQQPTGNALLTLVEKLPEVIGAHYS